MEELSQKEYEMINRFIDRDLSDDEILTFTERLSEDERLKTEVAEMIRVKKLVRSLPEVQPPRKYFLTRSMADEVRTPSLLERLFPFFRIAAAVCSLTLILSFLLPITMPNHRAAEPMSKALIMESVSKESADVINDEETFISGIGADEKVSVYGGRPGTHHFEGASPAAMPSSGIYGGSPRNEYEYRRSRGIDPMPKPSLPSSEAEENETTTEDQQELGDILAHRWVVLLRVIFSLMLSAALIWIFLTLRKRNQLKVR